MSQLLYIGTYTGPGKAEGIYVYRFDSDTGTLTHAHTVPGLDNPSFLAIDRQRRHLYAVNELSEYEGQEQGAVSAFAVDATTGNLRALNRQPTFGTASCYVSLDPSERYVMIANYGTGNLAVYLRAEDGSLQSASDRIQHEGFGPTPRRQQGPRAHSVLPTPDGKYVFSCDLGIDRVQIYRLDVGTGKLQPNVVPFAQVSSGAGPRHVAFHPHSPVVYVNNEIDSTISVFAYDADRGALTITQTLSTLPQGWSGRNSTAQVVAHPSGRFVYVSNRGHDSIAIFSADSQSGRLAPAGHVGTQGKTPRNFNLDLTGTWLLAANQDTGNVVTFRVDPESGRLDGTGATQVAAPVCLVFARA